MGVSVCRGKENVQDTQKGRHTLDNVISDKDAILKFDLYSEE